MISRVEQIVARKSPGVDMNVIHSDDHHHHLQTEPSTIRHLAMCSLSATKQH